MTILQILVLCLTALLVGSFLRGQWRGWILLVASLAAAYWMQPLSPIPHLDFWLPSVSIALAIFTWVASQPTEHFPSRETWMTAGVVAGLLLIVGLLRYLNPVCCLTPSRPPELASIFLLLIAIAGLAAIMWKAPARNARLAGMLLLILALFVILKTEILSVLASSILRSISGRSVISASAMDIRWLGFSYIAFRLLHIVRDRQSGRLPPISLQEFLIYIFFFPALPAGPIDRSQRFVQDLRKEFHLTPPEFLKSGQRVALGFFKKFVLADSLALIALNETLANQTTSSSWLCLFLVAYSLRIYFDFSGYTDIAIGTGQWMGIRLPENFDRPYLKPNLTLFWNSWHMTLAQWFRAYFFNPLTRFMRSAKHPLAMPLIIFCGQLGTMVLIGLWHGVTWNFLIWGIWHGLGLFGHNRWADFSKTRLAGMYDKPWLKPLLETTGTLLTFFYVTLGWIWFALPDPDLSWKVLSRLFGYGQ
jgi:D-alanyl-lipoteichoic acid acyltransferase DltB (MBOAT superfamily)